MTRTVLHRSALSAAALLLAGTALPASAATFFVDFTELNNSGVTGSAQLDYDETAQTLTVSINATGLVPNQPHVGHIHGLFSNGQPANSVVPPPSADTDGDGIITVAEGAPFYGPIILPLSGISNITVGSDGVLNYSQMFDLSDASIFNESFRAGDLFPLSFREIVLHGGFANGQYVPTLPVAAGDITAAIPEPATWAMMLLGFFGIGGVLRSRKAKVASQRVSYGF